MVWNDLLEKINSQLGNKKRFDKEKIGVKEPFPVTNYPFGWVWFDIKEQF